MNPLIIEMIIPKHLFPVKLKKEREARFLSCYIRNHQQPVFSGMPVFFSGIRRFPTEVRTVSKSHLSPNGPRIPKSR